MKILLGLSRFVVGVLFIFSGLVKVNDPKGTAIKLEEYFEVFASDFTPLFRELVPYSLYIAVFIIVLEVILGVAVLIWWRMRGMAWVLLVLISFFTFLTFYSAYFNKVTDCGCFGDAIPLDPWQSFYKDIILFFFIIIIFINRKRDLRFLTKTANAGIIILTIAASTWLCIYAINHLPFIDFRAYKIGNDIGKMMKPSAPLKYTYIMEKDGETYEFQEYPTEGGYEYKDIVLQNPEAQAKITDFSVWNNESEADFEAFRHEHQLAVPYYFVDGTVSKTMIRSNPGLLLLDDGVVKGKWHYNDVPDAATVKRLTKE